MAAEERMYVGGRPPPLPSYLTLRRWLLLVHCKPQRAFPIGCETRFIPCQYLRGSNLPGFERNVYERDHALIMPESCVFRPLHGWYTDPVPMWHTRGNADVAVMATRATGTHFTMALAKLRSNASPPVPSEDVERSRSRTRRRHQLALNQLVST
eukprot:jgi/Chlat1/1188/Chrsp114S01648